jgi:malate dehydrogenase
MNERSIGIIGVGKLGSDVAFTLAERNLAQVLLFDKDREKAEYLASDLSETAFGSGYTTGVSAVERMSDLTRCDVILIAAGRRREAEDKAEALFKQNRALMKEVAEVFTGSSTLFVVASEPVDLLTAELVRLMKLPFSRVLGLGGVLDAYRVRHLLGESMQINPDYIRNQVLGPHDSTVLPLWDFTSVNGIPVRSVVGQEVLQKIEEEMAADTGSGVPPGSSSRYTPAMACLDLLDALLRDDRRILSTTVMWDNILGVSGVALAVPCVVGRLGAERIVVPEVDETGRRAITDAATKYATILKGARA